jgi:hypothetical protein
MQIAHIPVDRVFSKPGLSLWQPFIGLSTAGCRKFIYAHAKAMLDPAPMIFRKP